MTVKLTTGGIRQMYDASVEAYARPRREAFAGWRQKRATLEPVSAAFAEQAEVTYLGDNGQPWPKVSAVSEVTFRFNQPANEIFRRIEALVGDPLPFMRGGGPYYAGPYANKQVKNWTKPGHKDLIIEDAFELYRLPLWQEELKPKLLTLLGLETKYALDGLALAQTDPEYYIIADKPPSTGTGYRGIRTRKDAAAAIARGSMVSLFEHDLNTWGEGQQAIWQGWPQQGTWISGFIGYKGTVAGSRSDVDITSYRRNPDGTITLGMEAETRGVNITPVSLFATKHTFTKQQMGDLLVRWEAPGYTARPTDVLAHVFEAPPCTCTFETDVVNIGGDFGYTYPAPYTEGQDSKWHLVMPKEVDKSGADGFIGQGCGTLGCTGIFTPEWSSGRFFTRVGYEIFCDHNVAGHLRSLRVPIKFACSLGDDQNVVVRYEDFPYVINSRLGKHLRLKGSMGNTEFRYGKQCVWDGPDHVYVFNMPRAIKTVTSAARASTEVAALLAGETATLSALPHAIEAAAKTWEIAPDVFFMEGSPKEIGKRILSRDYQNMLQDAILAGAVDQHVATYVGRDLDEELEQAQNVSGFA